MDDTIKRSDAIKVVGDYFEQIGHTMFNRGGEELSRIVLASAPSADRPRGEWIEKSKTECKTIGSHSYTRCYCRRECSYCGYERDDNNPNKDTNFCPNCGCRMKGADDE